MKNQKNTNSHLDFFLGCFTALGYQSDSETLWAEPHLRPVLLKGTVASEKSQFLWRVAQGGAEAIECIHAPHDPSRLVGVVLAKQSLAILDANEPQNVTPIAACAYEHIVSLYQSANEELLRAQYPELRELIAQRTCVQTRVARYIASLAGLLFDSRRAATCATNFEKIDQYVTRLCARALPPLEGKVQRGTETRRFLSAITPDGNVCYSETIKALATRVVVFHDAYGAASRAILMQLRTEALARGYDIITCPCSLFPDEKIEHIIIPSLQLAFVTSNTWHPMEFSMQQNIHCSRFANKKTLDACRQRLRFNQKAAQELQAQCVALLAQEQACTEAIRKIYAPAIDTACTEEIYQNIAQRFGLMLTPKG